MNDDESLNSFISDYSFLDDEEEDEYDQLLNALMEEYNHVYGVVDEELEFGKRFVISDFSDSYCIKNFRFRKTDLKQLANQLWPKISNYLYHDDEKIITLQNRYKAPYETCLCLYLYRLSYTRRIAYDMEKQFGMRRTHIGAALKTFGEALMEVSIRYLSNVGIWKDRMQLYADAVYEKTGLLDNIWGFIDCTIRKVCKPTYFQRSVYTRYKKIHALKFQSIVVPEGYIASLTGPYLGRTHDARIMRESGLLEMLRSILPMGMGVDGVFALYGDGAYPICPHILKGYHNPHPDSAEAAFNRAMSTARISVEWGFSMVANLWSFVDFSQQMKIFHTSPAQYYLNAAFFTNCHCAFYGNITSNYFKIPPQGIDDYLSLVPDKEFEVGV